MKTARLIGLFAFAGALVAAAGCSVESKPTATGSDESELRSLSADEINGEIKYGETKEDAFTSTPPTNDNKYHYHSYWFTGQQGDQIQATASPDDATDPILWLTDANFVTLAVNDDLRPTDLSAGVSKMLPADGKYYVVFREVNSAPKWKFAVSVKKTGSLSPSCDPDSEGLANPECTDALGFDPFDPSSCTGPAITSTDATSKLSGANGIPLQNSKIYFHTRQCRAPDGATAPACSPWVRSFLMDVPLTKVSALAGSTTTFEFVAATTRKIKVDFDESGTLKQFCLDGPFPNVLNAGWVPGSDGTSSPPLCSLQTASAPAVTDACARFEPPTVQVSANDMTDPTRYTEYGFVLLAKY